MVIKFLEKDFWKIFGIFFDFFLKFLSLARILYII